MLLLFCEQILLYFTACVGRGSLDFAKMTEINSLGQIICWRFLWRCKSQPVKIQVHYMDHLMLEPMRSWVAKVFNNPVPVLVTIVVLWQMMGWGEKRNGIEGVHDSWCWVFGEVGISLVTLVLSRLCLSFCLACASSFGEVWHAWWSLLQGFYCQIRCKRLFFGVLFFLIGLCLCLCSCAACLLLALSSHCCWHCLGPGMPAHMLCMAWLGLG